MLIRDGCLDLFQVTTIFCCTNRSPTFPRRKQRVSWRVSCFDSVINDYLSLFWHGGSSHIGRNSEWQCVDDTWCNLCGCSILASTCWASNTYIYSIGSLKLWTCNLKCKFRVQKSYTECSPHAWVKFSSGEALCVVMTSQNTCIALLRQGMPTVSRTFSVFVINHAHQ